jgi:hypothetical protein
MLIQLKPQRRTLEMSLACRGTLALNLFYLSHPLAKLLQLCFPETSGQQGDPLGLLSNQAREYEATDSIDTTVKLCLLVFIMLEDDFYKEVIASKKKDIRSREVYLMYITLKAATSIMESWSNALETGTDIDTTLCGQLHALSLVSFWMRTGDCLLSYQRYAGTLKDRDELNSVCY